VARCPAPMLSMSPERSLKADAELLGAEKRRAARLSVVEPCDGRGRNGGPQDQRRNNFSDGTERGLFLCGKGGMFL